MPAHKQGSPPDDPYLTLPLTVRVKEACRLTGIGRSKLYLLMREGQLEFVKVGTMTLISMASLKELLDPQRK
jgi:excisionase family DNA binding protein